MKTPTICAAIAAAITIAASAVMPASAATNITENVTLTEDTDWTEFGTVTVAEGVTIDLNGHSLTVTGLAGAGRIVDGDEYRRVFWLAGRCNYMDNTAGMECAWYKWGSRSCQN